MKTKSKPAAYFDPPAMNQQAIASQFKEFRTEVADAIRAKKGTTESINPQDFAEEIASIETGGGGNYVYYNTSSDGNIGRFLQFASVGKVVMNDITGFMTAIQIVLFQVPTDNILALGFDMSLKVNDIRTAKLVTIGETLDAIGIDLPQITEEEFYRDPNALEDGYFRVLSEYENTDVILQYDDGMTWRDWINSHYNLNPTTNKPYISTNNEEHVNWNYSDGWSGSMHNKYESDSSIEIDDLITNKTYYAVIIA